MSQEIRIIRAVAAILLGIGFTRVYSYARERRRGGFGDFLKFLSVGILSPFLVYSPLRREPLAANKSREILRFLIAFPLIPIAWNLGRRLISIPVVERSWLLNHLVVLAGFVVIMQSFGQVCYATWRLRGLRVKVLVDNILLSRTPADFWRRWSWPMHLWLYRYVYTPSGGKKHQVRAVLAVFLVNGLLHEAVAVIAIGRVTWHQTIYFLASALGVLASPALERLGRFGIAGEIAMRAITLTFLGASAAIMFMTIHYVVPIYYKQIWLMW